jgi:hypothetical protein
VALVTFKLGELGKGIIEVKENFAVSSLENQKGVGKVVERGVGKIALLLLIRKISGA